MGCSSIFILKLQTHLLVWFNPNSWKVILFWFFILFFLKMGQSRPFFVYFRYFLITISIIEKSIDGVLGIWTRGRRMVGADETTELWRGFSFLSNNFYSRIRTRIIGVEGKDTDHQPPLCNFLLQKVRANVLN